MLNCAKLFRIRRKVAPKCCRRLSPACRGGCCFLGLVSSKQLATCFEARAMELWIHGLGLTWSLSHISHAAAITAATYCCRCRCHLLPGPKQLQCQLGWKKSRSRRVRWLEMFHKYLSNAANILLINQKVTTAVSLSPFLSLFC